MYSHEELEPLLNPLREQANEIGFRGPIINYLAQRVRANLHVALIMDFASEQFVVQCESNPSLYKLCAVQWMEGWSRESMLHIPRMLVAKWLRGVVMVGKAGDEKDGKDKGKRAASAISSLPVPIDKLCEGNFKRLL